MGINLAAGARDAQLRPRRTGHVRFMIALAVATLSSQAVWAADSANKDSASRINELEQRLQNSLDAINRLEARIRTLESSAKAMPGASSRVEPTPVAKLSEDDAAKIRQIETSVAQITAAANQPRQETGLPLRGFADVGAGRRSGNGNKGFNIGSLDFYLTPSFSGGFRGLVELIFENDNNSLATDLERMQIGYDFGDNLTLWAGRFHTPYGYWNNAFHHGAQIQTSITRPRFIAFEDAGGVLPAHSVGLWATGKAPAMGGKLNYNAYVANAQSIAGELAGAGVLNPNTTHAFNGRFTVGGSIGFRPEAVNGLEVGLHALQSTIGNEFDPTNDIRLKLFGGYLAYESNNWEIVGETYHFNNRAPKDGAGRHSSTAVFLQAGYNFGALTPFLRYERGNFSAQDSYFAQQENGRAYDRSVGGFKFDLTSSSAFKLEFLKHRGRAGNTEHYDEARAQLAVRF